MKNIVLVPAREKSKEIRYKNLRILDKNKTLLEIAYENSLKISDEIWLSSESDLLNEYGKLLGYKIKKRPEYLSKDNSTLDEVVNYHINQNYLENDDIFWVLQPTCPFLRLETITKIKELLLISKYQSVFTAKKVKGFHWQQTNEGNFLRSYKERLNRQTNNNNIICETGLLTATKVSYLRKENNTRFDEGFSYPVLVDDIESIDIDSHDDLLVARKKYKFHNKKILVLSKANSKIGSGHLYRSLSICDNSSNIECILACYEDEISSNILKNNERNYIPIKENDDLINYLKNNPFSLIIIDILHIDPLFLESIKKEVPKVVIFENYDQDCINQADLVFNALYESSIGIKNVFNGYKYEIIRSDIKAYKGLINNELNEKKDIFKLVVCFGGTDHNYFTRKMNKVYSILEEIISDPYKVEITEILNLSGNNSSGWIPSKANFSINSIKHSSLIAKEMSQCDLLLCGNGRMVYEAVSLEKQVIVIPQNSRECSHIFPRALPLSFMMNHWTEVDCKDIAYNIYKVFKSNLSNEQKDIIRTIANDIHAGASKVWGIIENIL